MRKNSRLVFSIAAITTLAFTLSGCSIGAEPFAYETSEPCPDGGPDQTGPGDFSVSIDDNSPSADQPFDISLGLPPGIGESDVEVEYALGFFDGTSRIFQMIEDDNDSDYVFIAPVPPVPSSSPTPSPSSVEARESIFTSIPSSTWVDRSLEEKIGVTNASIASRPDEEQDLQTFDTFKFFVPGIISVRCGSDAKGTMRAATAIYPNYVDNMENLTFRTSTASTGSIVLSDGQVDFRIGQMATYLTPWEYLPVNPTINDYWIQSIGQQLAGGDTPYSLFAEPDFSDPNVLVSVPQSAINEGSVEYDVSLVPEGEYLVFAAFLDESNLVDGVPDLGGVKTAFFKVTIDSTGVETIANLVGDTFSTPVSAQIRQTPSGSTGGSYIPSPFIDKVSVQAVSRAGGRLVTVTGTNLQGAKSFKVDGVEVPILSNSPTEISFRAPSAKIGTANLVVTTEGGSNFFPATIDFIDAPKNRTTRVISGFSTGKAVITKKASESISSASRLAVGYTHATCYGMKDSTPTAKENALSLKRAKLICTELAKANPELRVNVGKTVVGGSSSRAQAKLVLSYK